MTIVYSCGALYDLSLADMSHSVGIERLAGFREVGWLDQFKLLNKVSPCVLVDTQ